MIRMKKGEYWGLEFDTPQEKVRAMHILSTTWSKEIGGSRWHN
jgi:hypothetical protein